MTRRLAKAALAAYPLAFRRRYGEEMLALVEDSPPSAGRCWTCCAGRCSPTLALSRASPLLSASAIASAPAPAACSPAGSPSRWPGSASTRRPRTIPTRRRGIPTRSSAAPTSRFSSWRSSPRSRSSQERCRWSWRRCGRCLAPEPRAGQPAWRWGASRSSRSPRWPDAACAFGSGAARRRRSGGVLDLGPGRLGLRSGLRIRREPRALCDWGSPSDAGRCARLWNSGDDRDGADGPGDDALRSLACR